jgi:hypothetical protein
MHRTKFSTESNFECCLIIYRSNNNDEQWQKASKKQVSNSYESNHIGDYSGLVAQCMQILPQPNR